MQTRRSYLKTAGVLAASSVPISTAGCLGGADTDSSGDGESGDGGSTGSTKTELTEIPMSAFPVGGPPTIAQKYVHEETSILEDMMADAGYKPSVNFTFEGPALFASGQVDIAFGDLSTYEGVLLANERDQELVVTTKNISLYDAIWTRTGSKWDVENTGSVEATMRLFTEEGRLGHGGWSGGDIPAYRLLMDKLYSLKFEEGGDFNVVTADLLAIADLLADEKIDGGSTAPHFGTVKYLLQDEPSLSPVFWIPNLTIDNDLGVPPLSNIICKKEFWEEHSEAMIALSQAYQLGIEKVAENPDDFITQEKYWDVIGASNQEEADFNTSWFLPTMENEYQPDIPPVYIDGELTGEYIENDKKFIDNAAEIGLIPEDWENLLTYEPVDVHDF